MHSPVPPRNLAAWIRRFDLLSLRLFLTAVEEGSLQRAAEREMMTPSAATKRLQALEEGLGVQLIERTARGLQLTAAGELVATRLREVMAGLGTLHGELQALVGALAGTLTVVANTSTWVGYLGEDVGEFARNHAAVRLELRDATTPDVLRSVIEEGCDVGICPIAPPAPAGLRIAPYRTDHLVVVMAPGHPCASARSMTLRQLLQQDLVGWSPRGSVMRTVQQAAEGIGAQFRLRYQMHATDSARALVRAGLGVAVMPQAMVRPFDDESRLTAVAITEAWAERRICIVTRDASPAGSLVEAFVGHLTRGSPPAQ